MDEINKAIADELSDVVKYMDMAHDCEHGSILEDIAAEEMQHARNLRGILEMEGKPVQDMAEQWKAARMALYGVDYVSNR